MLFILCKSSTNNAFFSVSLDSNSFSECEFKSKMFSCSRILCLFSLLLLHTQTPMKRAELSLINRYIAKRKFQLRAHRTKKGEQKLLLMAYKEENFNEENHF